MNYLEGVKTVVEFIVQAKGGITASELVEAAKDESSPAHGAFEWDDAIAGHEHRLSQARKYLRTVSVSYRSAESREVLVCVPRRAEIVADRSEPDDDPCFDERGRQGQYRPISAVVADPDALASAERQFISIIASAARALRQLREAAIAASRADLIENIDLTETDLSTIAHRMIVKPTSNRPRV